MFSPTYVCDDAPNRVEGKGYVNGDSITEIGDNGTESCGANDSPLQQVTDNERSVYADDAFMLYLMYKPKRSEQYLGNPERGDLVLGGQGQSRSERLERDGQFNPAAGSRRRC